MARKKSNSGPAESTGHHIVTRGFGPGPDQDGHGDWDITVPYGIFTIPGPNGTGKTRGCFLPVAKALNQSVDVPVELRHGAAKGTVEIDGEVVWVMSKNTHEKRDVELWLLTESSPLADVICPLVKDPKLAEPRRVEAVLKLVQIPVTDEVVDLLAGASDSSAVAAEAGKSVVERMRELEPKLTEKSVIDISEMAIKISHSKKREWEDKAQVLTGEILALGVDSNETLPAPEELSDLTVEEADQAYRAAIGNQRETLGGFNQRQDRERERAEIESTLGDRPDVQCAEARIVACGAVLDEFNAKFAATKARIEELQRELTELQSNKDIAAREHQAAQMLGVDTAKAAAGWDRRKAILDTPITGPTAKDLEVADRRVQEAADELDSARVTAKYRESATVLEIKQASRNGALNAASTFEKLAKGVRGRLAQILESAGLERLTVDGGVLHYRHEDGTLEPFKSLSEGERWIVALTELAVRNEPPLGMLFVPRRAIDSLDAKNRAKVEKFLIERKLSVVIEEPGE